MAGSHAVEDVARAIIVANAGFQQWTRISVENRAAILERAADLIEERRGRFLYLLQVEGGKTIDDAVSEVGRRQTSVGTTPVKRGGPWRCLRTCGADRRNKPASTAWARYIRGDLAMEFSVGDISGAGHGCFGRGQLRDRQTGRTDVRHRI